ncbi:MAG TPA: cytochrome c [Sphingobium sp.]
MQRRPLFILASLLALTGTAATAAAALTAQQAVDMRKNRYRELGAAFKTINDQVKSGTLVKVMLRSSARIVTGVARDQYQFFPAGSGPAASLSTKAKAIIWSDPAGFKQAQANFQRQADAMAIAAESGQLDQVQKQAKALGQTCAACHKSYRED